MKFIGDSFGFARWSWQPNILFLDFVKTMTALDPFGHMVTQVYGDWLDKGWYVTD